MNKHTTTHKRPKHHTAHSKHLILLIMAFATLITLINVLVPNPTIQSFERERCIDYGNYSGLLTEYEHQTSKCWIEVPLPNNKTSWLSIEPWE